VALDFDIAPAFYQTALFRLALVLAGLLAVALLFRWRLWRVRQVLHGQMLARQAERERIARELHDTLLQGLTAVVLRFHSFLLKGMLSPELRASMEDALNRADQVIEEGRDRVLELRVADNPLGLAAALDECARHLVADPSTRWAVDTVGPHRELHAAARHELFQIGKEAMANAFQHAQAGRVDVTLGYGRQQLLLRVRDDGHGLPAEVAQTGRRPGHWGLASMRERAQRLGGQWRVDSSAEGTCIEVTVPATVAYRQGHAPTRPAWRRWSGFRRGRPEEAQAIASDDGAAS
jgi:signal transduction histidine kinase